LQNIPCRWSKWPLTVLGSSVVFVVLFWRNYLADSVVEIMQQMNGTVLKGLRAVYFVCMFN